MWSDYLTPKTLDETIELLAAHAPHARLIAGGTDLVIELDRGLRTVQTLIDISRLPKLSPVSLDAEGRIHLGVAATHNDLLASALCVERAFPLAQACRRIGAPQIRNRGTIAGNLVTASPANDSITPLMVLDAVLTLRSVRGKRVVKLVDFYTGVRRTVLQPDEMLVDIAFKALQPNQRGCYLKLALRRAQAISVVNCAVVLTMEGARVVEARIALGAVTPTIVRVSAAEASLVGHALDAGHISHAAELARQAASPISDVRSTAEYRAEMVQALVSRALHQLADGTERAEWSDEPVLLDVSSVMASSAQTQTEVQSAQPGNTLDFQVNGRPYHIQENSPGGKTLLRLLREDCGLIGTKEGCAEGECGACTLLLDGKAVMSCLVPAPRAQGAEIVTIEGVGGVGRVGSVVQDGTLHPLQTAFIQYGAVQCGYCTPGFIMSGAALLVEHAHPTEDQIKESISGNLCRCTGYYKILEAMRAAVPGVAVVA